MITMPGYKLMESLQREEAGQGNDSASGRRAPGLDPRSDEVGLGRVAYDAGSAAPVVDGGLSQFGAEVLAKHVDDAMAICVVDNIDHDAGTTLFHAHVVIGDADVIEHEIEAHDRVGSECDAQP